MPPPLVPNTSLAKPTSSDASGSWISPFPGASTSAESQSQAENGLGTTIPRPGNQVSPLPVGSSGRPTRSRCLPGRFRDVLPEPAPSLTGVGTGIQPESSTSTPQSDLLPRIILHVFDSLRTSFNKFGIARYYRHHPSYDPDALVMIDQLSNTTSNPPEGILLNIYTLPPAPPWPWKNMGVW